MDDEFYAAYTFGAPSVDECGGPVRTGLLDQRGRPIYYQKRKVGFDIERFKKDSSAVPD